MATASEKQKNPLFHHILGTNGSGEVKIWGRFLGEPDVHAGIEDDGYVRLIFETREGYKNSTGAYIELEMIAPEGEGFEHISDGFEFDCVPYVSKDAIGNMCIKPFVIKVFDTDKNLFLSFSE